MLAQKTPTTALLINMSETWNSLYFQDLMSYQMQLSEDCLLRMLFLNYLRTQRNWLQRFSVKKYAGRYYIQFFCVTANQEQSLLPIIQKESIFDNNLVRGKNLNEFYWDHYVPFKALKTTVYSKMQQVKTQSQSQRVKFLVSDVNMSFRRLRKWVTSLWKKQNKVIRIFRNKYRAKLRYQNRHMATLQGLALASEPYFFEKTKNTSIKFVATKFNLKRTYDTKSSAVHFKPHKLMLFILKWVVKFFRKRTRRWQDAIQIWFKKWGHKLRFKRNMERRLTILADYWAAAQRLTKTQCLLHYKANTWLKARYKPVTLYVIFERFRSKPYLSQVLAATHYAISQGTPVVLTDFIRLYLMQLQQHKTFLKSVHTALRYFLSYQGYLMIDPNSFCQGAKVTVSGKIDGSDRKKTLTFLIGAIPTGSTSSHIVYDQSSIMTRYGSLHVHVWLSYKFFDESEKVWRPVD